jgi:hypothetical protein
MCLIHAFRYRSTVGSEIVASDGDGNSGGGCSVGKDSSCPSGAVTGKRAPSPSPGVDPREIAELEWEPIKRRRTPAMIRLTCAEPSLLSDSQTRSPFQSGVGLSSTTSDDDARPGITSTGKRGL